MFALVLPFAQAEAQQCVLFQGLNHCGVGSARLYLTQAGLRVETSSTSGSDGVVSYLGQAATWTANAFTDTAGAVSEQTVLTAVAEGAPTSSATLAAEGGSTTYLATFTGTGTQSTYSASVYRQGILQAAVGGIPSGSVALRTIQGGGPDRFNPACRPSTQTYDACIYYCRANNYASCSYCGIPCYRRFGVTYRGACQWAFSTSAPSVQLADGRVVLGDEIVLTEEVTGPSSYPYLAFDRMVLRSTARSVTITSESVTPAAK
jgi:hypothetical protein